MQYLISANKDQFAAIKAAAKAELVGIAYVIKHRKDFAIDIFSREGEVGQWGADNATRVHAFIVAQGLLGPTGETPGRDTVCYTGLRFQGA